MTANYVLIEEIALNANALSVTFDNIPQTGYTDLKVVVSARKVESGGGTNLQMRFNGSTTGYSQRTMIGNGTSIINAIDTSEIGFMYVNDASQTANTFNNTEIYIPNAFGSNNKTVSIDNIVENNATASAQVLTAASWSSSAPISSIYLQVGNGTQNFAAGSTFSLYGIATVGTTPTVVPKASGGDIVANDGTFWYHAFLTSGSFTPNSNLVCDILLVGGGGGGSNSGGIGAGGGGGCVRFDSNVNLTGLISNTVTVGAGGVADARSNEDGGAGFQSTFGMNIASVSNRAIGSANAGGRDGGNGGGSRKIINGVTTNYSGGLGAVGFPRRGGSGAGANSNGSSSYPAVGGNGLNTWSAWASATGTGDSGFFAGGGAGGFEQNGGMSRTAGGLGGGGQGGAGTSAPNYDATPGLPNTGGGGGGCGGQAGVIGGLSGNGGSGIVIVRYAMV